jgi:hypothetical protein
MATCGTMIWEGDVVVASGGYPKAETIAVKADGSGKVACLPGTANGLTGQSDASG